MKLLVISLLMSVSILSYASASNADFLGIEETSSVPSDALMTSSAVKNEVVQSETINFREVPSSKAAQFFKSKAIETIEGLDHDDKIYANRPYTDLDEDGVLDRIDFCPNSKKGYPVDINGCEADSDRDGISYRLDQCPTTPLGIEVNFLGCDPDDDLDLVLNSLDQCPGTPIGIPVNELGCNISDDDDRDGVSNNRDQCPTTPLGRTVNRFGCEAKDIVITNIIFDTGSYNIPYDQRQILNHDIAQLNDTKEDEIIVITGHTDNVGTAVRNEQLSWNRAQSVKDYLITNMNYNENNIYVLGEGEYMPIVDNSTSSGRQENRRIEFAIVKKGLVPTRALPVIPDGMRGYTRYPTR